MAVVDTAHSPVEACAKFNGLTRGIRLPDFCGGEFQGIQDSHWIEQASLGKNSLLVSLLAEDGQRYELRYSPDP